MTSDYSHIIGKEYEFTDGVKLRVIQIKQRDTGLYITYEHVYQSAMPRRFVQQLSEFVDTYGHLFPKQ
jgi:hypothetical protein